MSACKLNGEEAAQLLDNYHWKVDDAIRFWHNEQKKMEKINKKLQRKKGQRIKGVDDNELIEGKTTIGQTEMIEMNPNQQNDQENNDEFDNSHQGSLTAGFCCN